MRNRPTILVVDDEPKNAKLVEAYLLRDGYEVVKAYSGDEALGKMSEKTIDVVLLDVMMPGIDGLEVTRRLKSC